MGHAESHRKVLSTSTVVLAAALAITGCMSGSHPDDQAAIYNSLGKNGLESVMVAQNRSAGVITLTGIVGSATNKSQAGTLATQAAPGYTVDNKIQVQVAGLQGTTAMPAGTTKADNAIENHFKATIEAHRVLDEQQIEYSANNGTLYLKGAVKTPQEKKEAEELAKKVPQVQRVVNEIQVMPRKHAPSNS